MSEDGVLDALFLSSVYSGLKCCPSLLDTTSISVPLCNFRKHSLLFATSKNSPTARWVLAANLVFNYLISLGILITLLKQILNWNLLYWVVVVVIIIIIIITIIIIAIINVCNKENTSVEQILSNLFNFFFCVCVCVLYLFCASFVIDHCAVKLAH
jgi:hypothetical protein